MKPGAGGENGPFCHAIVRNIGLNINLTIQIDRKYLVQLMFLRRMQYNKCIDDVYFSYGS